MGLPPISFLDMYLDTYKKIALTILLSYGGGGGAWEDIYVDVCYIYVYIYIK